jgi:hypothetical protein
MKLGRGNIGSEMSILDSLIVFSCVGLSGQQNTACNKALEAGSQQSGFQQTVNNYEGHELKIFEKDAYDWFGRDAVDVVGGTAWVTKSLVEKRASVGLPNLGLCDNLVTEVDRNTAKLVFKWRF